MAALCLAFVFGGTVPSEAGVATNRFVKLAVNPWSGSALDAEVAKILLQEKLGYTVELVPIDEYAQFPALANGDLSATLEVWPSGHPNDRQVYIEEQKTVEDLGPLGVIGQIGWYLPSYMVESEPSLATWEGIKAHAGLFQTAATGSQGQLLEGDPTWIYHDQEIITGLGLNLKIVQAGSESALLAAVDAAYSRREPLLFYFWTPHAIHSRYQFTEIKLPPFVAGCGGCGYPPDVLYKAASAKLRELAPAAYRFLKNMNYSQEDQIGMMGEVLFSGKTPEAAARAWIQQHEAQWSAWLQSGSPGGQPAIPAPANAWAAHYLYVLDKDTNGVFLNANNLYWQSLQPLFPEIQSVTNLTGHDDFYFYPADLANKFRADDRKVLAGGVPLVTVEVNEPAGGPRTIVRVTKVPLRDENERIIGLRAIWHSHPQLEISAAPGGVDVSFPADADIFRLERTDDLGSPSLGLPQIISSNAVGGRISVRMPATGAQGYFHLRADRPVTIGALLSLTGDWSSLGRNCRAALQAGLESINLEQLSSGSPLHFSADIRDTRLVPETALAELQSLASAGVKFVIGPQSSAELRVLKPFADAHEIILISPSSTASSLAFTNDNLFRFCPDDTYEAAAMVALLRADGIQAVVPIWRDDAGNQGLHDSTARLFPAQGGVISAGIKYGANETNFSAAASALRADLASTLTNFPGKTAVYLAGFDEVAELFKVARSDQVLGSVPWYGSDGVVQSEVLAGNAPAAEFAAGHGYPCPTFGLDARFRDIWQPLATLIKNISGNEVDAFTLAAYDALQVSVLAYRSAGNEAPFSTLRAAFVQAADSYIGATGPTLLNAAGDRDGGAFDFWSLRAATNGYVWFRSGSFQPQPGGGGEITRNP